MSNNSSSEPVYSQLCSNCEQHVSKPASTKRCSFNGERALLGVVLVVVVLNCSVSVYTLNALHKASTQLSSGTQGITDVTSQLSQLSSLASTLVDAIGPATRLNFNVFPVNVPNVLNELLRWDFHDAAKNISQIALAVESAFRFSNDARGMSQAANYASLVASIGKQATYLKTVNGGGSPTTPDPANNDLLHMVTSALLNVVDFEFDDPQPWSNLAQTCMQFIDNFMAVSWSGVYRGPNGQRREWNVNNAIQYPFEQIYEYCNALANITEQGGSLLDMLSDDFDVIPEGKTP